MKFTRKSFSLGFASVLALSTMVQAANICVGPSATGDGSGRDWSNLKAWNSTPVRGDTWYLANGTYSGKSFSVVASGTTPIRIKKATTADHGTATGWNSTYGDGQATFNGQISFSSSYWEFDGVTGGGPGKWNTGFGFKIVEPSDSKAVLLVGYNSTANNVTVRHVDLQGKGSVSSAGGSYSNDAVAVYGDSNFTLSYYWMHGIGRCPFFITPVNMVAEYGYVQSYYGSGSVHSEIASIWGFGGKVGDCTFRHSLFTDVKSTGGLMWDNSSNTSARLLVYGNVFYRPSTASWEQANGVIGGWTGGGGEQMHNVKVYNNTFININQQSLSTLPNIASGCEAKNNLWYNSTAPSFSKFPTHNYNHFISSGSTQGESNGTTASSGDPFVGFANLNFQLKANTSPGEKLASPYDVDATGKTRTTWSRGAYEFGGQNSSPTEPTSPTSPTEPTSPTSPTSPTEPTSPTSPTPTATPAISVTPGSISFGSIKVGTKSDFPVSIRNSGTGTLTGKASVSAPFSIVSGASYSLSAGRSQTVTVRYSPTSVGTNSAKVRFTGGNGASVSVSGTATRNSTYSWRNRW